MLSCDIQGRSLFDRFEHGQLSQVRSVTNRSEGPNQVTGCSRSRKFLKDESPDGLQGRSGFDRFDFDMVQYFGFDVASIFRAQNPCWTELLVK